MLDSLRSESTNAGKSGSANHSNLNGLKEDLTDSRIGSSFQPKHLANLTCSYQVADSHYRPDGRSSKHARRRRRYGVCEFSNNTSSPVRSISDYCKNNDARVSLFTKKATTPSVTLLSNQKKLDVVVSMYNASNEAKEQVVVNNKHQHQDQSKLTVPKSVSKKHKVKAKREESTGEIIPSLLDLNLNLANLPTIEEWV